MKKLLALLLSVILLLSLCTITTVASEQNDINDFELPTPVAPNYFIYTDGDASEGAHDDLRMIMRTDPQVAQLAAEYYEDSDAFYKKYGLYSFNIVMQYDVSLDGEDNWQYTSEWDENYYTGGYADGYTYVFLGGEMMEDFEYFWLVYHEGQGSGSFVPLQPAIITERFVSDDYEEDIYSFDVENHSLYIRCRYYMEWEPLGINEYGEYPCPKQSKFSDWSESAVFGKNSTQIIPPEPTVYEAPVVSDLRIIPPSNHTETYHLNYTQTTPESVWLANVYYMMTGNGQFDGLETQVSIDGSEWIEFDTADSWGDWCLWNGERSTFNGDVALQDDSNVKLRIRFTGSHGPSEWSNVAEVNIKGSKIMGDADGDWEVSVMDATTVQRHMARLDTLSEYRFIYADTTRDGEIDVMDATIIQRFIARIITEI